MHTNKGGKDGLNQTTISSNGRQSFGGGTRTNSNTRAGTDN